MAAARSSEHVISLFRFGMQHLTPTQREEYSSTAERLLTLASAMPGLISFRHSTSDDGELLTVVEFASAEALTAWRDHPDHCKVRQRGRNDCYAEYEIINSAVMHKYGYKP